MEHKHADFLRIAANDKNQMFECEELIYTYYIGFVLTHPQYNWRPVKTTKTIKRWLWADKNGMITTDLFTEDEVKTKTVPQLYTIKLLWSETIFEVEE